MLDYVIVTPAKDEENYIRYTLDSVINQTKKPLQWIIVDDGSTDETVRIVSEVSKTYHFIKLVEHIPDNKERQGGSNVVRAFNEGVNNLNFEKYDFIVKLDADLTLPFNYFEEVGKVLMSDPRIGLSGGFLSAYSRGIWKKESNASYHLRGPIKAYRTECFFEIGGLKESLHWDFLDEMKAMYFGWKIKILPLEVKHHRKTSTLINKGLKSSVKIGKQHYLHGYDLFLALCRSVTYGIRTKPIIISSVAFMLGYLENLIKKPKKEIDPELEAFIKSFQYSRIKRVFLLRSFFVDRKKQ